MLLFFMYQKTQTTKGKKNSNVSSIAENCGHHVYLYIPLTFTPTSHSIAMESLQFLCKV
jgi:hypothetical protein